MEIKLELFTLFALPFLRKKKNEYVGNFLPELVITEIKPHYLAPKMTSLSRPAELAS